MNTLKNLSFEPHSLGGSFSVKHSAFEFRDDYRGMRRDVPSAWRRVRPVRRRQSTQELIENAVSMAADQLERLLSLGDDWDGDGAVGVTKETAETAVEIFQLTLAAVSFNSLSLLLSPRITPLADGSIDIRWKSLKFTLLVNISPKETSEARFYGLNNTQQDIRGSLKLDAPDFRFLNWLVS